VAAVVVVVVVVVYADATGGGTAPCGGGPAEGDLDRTPLGGGLVELVDLDLDCNLLLAGDDDDDTLEEVSKRD